MPQPSLWTTQWSPKKIRATVLNDIWPEVLFFSAVAAMVCLVSTQTPHNLGISNQMLTVLGTVLGLVISFRTSSAYERYQDGRKLWTTLMLTSRNLAQMIWIHVPNERVDKGKQKKQSLLESMIEKKSMVNLVQAFSVSVKHFCRGEAGIYYEDLYPLICFLPRYATHAPAIPCDDDMLPLWRASEYGGGLPTVNGLPKAEAAVSTANEPRRVVSEPTPMHEIGDAETQKNRPWYSSLKRHGSRQRSPQRAKTFDPEKVLPTVQSDQPLKPARSPPDVSIYDYLPLLRLFKPIFRIFHPNSTRDADRTTLGRKKKPEIVDSNVPLEITLHLSSYYAWLMECGLLTPPIATGFSNNLTSFQDTIASLERIRNTPLPFAYQVHLRMTVWLYIFFLPFEIYSQFKWLTIPATAFASFLLLGFLEIGQQIENPFNYDLNDLDLDHFCLVIQREMHEITAHPSPDPASYLFGVWNQPFAPADRRTAEEITRDKDHEYWGRMYGNRQSNDKQNKDGDNKRDGDTKDRDEDDKGKDRNLDKDFIDGEGANGEGRTSIRRMLLKNWREVDEMTRDHHHLLSQWHQHG